METSDPTTFGDLLKHFRKRQRVTQQAIADRVGVNFNTISKWERGLYLPESKALVLEVARQLRLSEPETRALLEASLTALAPSWLVPFPRNPFFTGRGALLERLHQRLQQAQAVAVSQSYALSGLGGIGKTQLALEYAYQHAQDYHAVFWVAAETAETLAASFTSIAEVLQLPERVAKEQPQVVRAVLRWLASHKEWLLIYDNVEDLLTLKPFLPAARQGAVLLTTRLHTLEGLAPRLDLASYCVAEGAAFLLARAGLREQNAPLEDVPQAQRKAAEALVEALGGLPLALDQAGAYIKQHACSFTDYLRLYQRRELALLAERSPAAEHPASVVTTLGLSFDQVVQASPAAAELLQACAFLAPEAIPEALFTEGAAPWGGALSAVAADADLFNRALGEALRYSLLQRDAQQHTLSLHRLVQAVLRGQLEEARQREWAERVVRLLAAAFPDPNDYAIWAECQRLLPHVLVCASHIERWGMKAPDGARLLVRAGKYLRERAQYEVALPLMQQGLAIREQTLGPDHPDVAESLHALARLSYTQGQSAQAVLLCQRALAIWEPTLGPDHPDVAQCLHTLAVSYEFIGQYAEALPLYQRALAVQEQALGPAHPEVANTLNSLGIFYWTQGKYQDAILLCQRALAIWEPALGPDHPQVARCLHNLAMLHYEQGQYAQAVPLLQRARAIREQTLGPEHPDVAISLNNLALLYHAQGQYAQAVPLLQRALKIEEQARGPNHLEVALRLNSLAIIYRDLGQYAEALPLLQQALKIEEQAVGPEHPEVATTLNSLALVYQAQGQYAEALPRAQRARAIWEQALGPDHLFVATSLNTLANFYLAQRQYQEALPLAQRALAIREQALGPEHPDVAQSLHTLATLSRVQGQYTYAELLFERALSIRKQTLIEHHPDTAATLREFAALREAKGQPQEAASLYQYALAIYEQVHGPEHPKTTDTRQRLRAVLQTLGRYEEAAALEGAPQERAEITGG